MKKQDESGLKRSAPSLLKNYCVIISSIVIILAGLHAARSVLGPFLMATFFAALLVSPVNWLKNRGFASWLSLSVVIVGVLLVGGGAATIVGSQIAQFARDIPEYRHRFITTLESYNLDLGDVIPFLKETPENPGEKDGTEEESSESELDENDEGQGVHNSRRSKKSRASRRATSRENRVDNELDDSENVETSPDAEPVDDADVVKLTPLNDSRDALEPIEIPPSEEIEPATGDDVASDSVPTEASQSAPPNAQESPDAQESPNDPETLEVRAESDEAEPATRPVAQGKTSSDRQESRLLPKTPPDILKSGSLFSDDSNPAYDDEYDPYETDDDAFVGKDQGFNAVKLSSQQLFRFLGGLAGELSYFASTALIVTLMLVFMLIETEKIPKKLAAAFGQSEFKDERVLGVLTDIRHYMAIKTEMSLLVGVLVTVLMFLSKVQYPLLWGFVAFLLNYIPNIGSVVAAIPPIVLATVEHGVAIGCADAVAFAVINCAVGYVLEPKLLGQGLDLSPLIVLIALIFFGWLLGPVGMFLSPPLAVVMKIILASFPETRWVAALMANKTLDSSGGPNSNEGGADAEAELDA